MRREASFLLALVFVAGALPAQQSPYTGLQGREIKALSAERVAALIVGDGAGYALAAELNGYPGPRHVLDLADSLALTPEQRVRIAEIFEKMRSAARRLGGSIVAREAGLDSAFASGTIDRRQVEQSVSELGRLEGELRAVHLAAHVDVTAVLSRQQVLEYGRLRGYAADEHDHDAARHRPSNR